jgi:ankyrin repeat protein
MKRETMIKACRSGDVATVRRIIIEVGLEQSAVDPGEISSLSRLLSAANSSGMSPLSHACWCGRAEVVDLLLRAGADVNMADATAVGWTPLHAASMGNATIVESLLRVGGVRKDVRDAFGSTPLFLAAFNDHRDVVKLLLDSGADRNIADEDGRTPLLVASRRGNLSVVELLLANGADVDAASHDGTTPLIAAASGGHADVVRLLLHFGADTDAKNGDGRTARDASKDPSISDMITREEDRRKRCRGTDSDSEDEEMHRRRGVSGGSPKREATISAHIDDVARMHEACRIDDADAVEEMLLSGFDKDRTSISELTPLNIACYNRSPRAVDVLLRHGADMEKAGLMGQTPLHSACFARHRNIVESLLRAGARRDSRDVEGRTPLDIASSVGYDDIVALLRGSAVVEVIATSKSAPLVYDPILKRFGPRIEEIKIPFRRLVSVMASASAPLAYHLIPKSGDQLVEEMDTSDAAPPASVPALARPCKVCMEREIDIALVPCGHVVVCGDCWLKFPEDKRECPVCRRASTSVLKIYIS